MSQQKEDDRIYILRSERPAKAVVKLGVPLIAGMFIMVLYNLVDTYFIGLMRDDYPHADSRIRPYRRQQRDRRGGRSPASRLHR